MTGERILRKYIINCFKNAKFRNVLLFFTISLTTVLFTIIFILAIQSNRVMQNEEARRVGMSADGLLQNATQKDYKAVKRNNKVKEAAYSIFVASWENERFTGRGVEIRYADELAAEMCYSKPEIGRMPQGENEIVVDTYILRALNLEQRLGQTVDLSFSFFGINYKGKFNIVGYYTENTSNIASTAYISKKYMNQLNSQLEKKDIKKVSQEQYYGSGLLAVMFNVVDRTKLSENYCKNIIKESGIKTEKTETYMNPAYIENPMSISSVVLIAFCCIIVMFTCYLTIYNVFQISIYRDVSQYGILNMIGADRRHLKKIVRMQSLFLCALAIPVGLLLGHFLGLYFLPKFMLISLGTYAEGVIRTTVSPVIYIISIIFVLITVFISCRRPAIAAASITPVEAVNFEITCDIKTGKKKCRPTIAYIASRNAFKDRKKAAVSIFSMSMSCILLLCVFSFANSFSLDKYIRKVSLGDIQISGSNWLQVAEESEDGTVDYSLNESVCNDIKNCEGVIGNYQIYYGTCTETADEKMKRNIKKLMEEGEFDKSDEGLTQILQGNQSLLEERYFIDENLLRRLDVVEGKIDKEKFLSGSYIIAARSSGNKSEVSFCHAGDKVLLNYPDQNSEYIEVGESGYYKESLQKEYTVMAIVDIPFYMAPSNKINGTFKVIAPICELSTLGINTVLAGIVLETMPDSYKNVEEWVSDYTSQPARKIDYVSKETVKKAYQKLVAMVKLIGGGLSIIIALIGILNYINAYITGVISRRKEFGMLRSIGATENQLKVMLIYENLYLVAIAAIIGIIFGFLLSWGCVKLISGVVDYFIYSFTPIPFILEIAAFIFISIVLAFSGYSLNHGSIVEAIREE